MLLPAAFNARTQVDLALGWPYLLAAWNQQWHSMRIGKGRAIPLQR